MKIEEIFQQASSDKAVIAALKEKSVTVPAWGGAKGLQKEYDPTLHPVMNRALYPDVVHNDGSLEAVTRITIDLQRLAVRRMSELVCGFSSTSFTLCRISMAWSSGLPVRGSL
jgi:S-adenosylhomocysteine hydrolase